MYQKITKPCVNDVNLERKYSVERSDQYCKNLTQNLRIDENFDYMALDRDSISIFKEELRTQPRGQLHPSKKNTGLTP